MSTLKRTVSVARSIGTDRISTPHKAYMKLSSLELEKARLLQEHATLLTRLRKLEERVRTIESEQQALHGALPEPTKSGVAAESARTGAAASPLGEVQPPGLAAPASTPDSRFRFRY